MEKVEYSGGLSCPRGEGAGAFILQLFSGWPRAGGCWFLERLLVFCSVEKPSSEEMALALAVSQSTDPRQMGREWTGAITSFIVLLAIYLSISIYYSLPTSFLFFALLLNFVLQTSTHFQPLLSTEILLQALYLPLICQGCHETLAMTFGFL